MRRAANDEALHTIARRLSHGECFSNEWDKHSKRFVPTIPRLNNESDTFYRILADHIVAKSQIVLDLYPSSSSNEDFNDINNCEMKDACLEEENEANHQIYKNNLTDKLNKLKEKIQKTSSQSEIELMSNNSSNQDKSNDISKSTFDEKNLNDSVKQEKSIGANTEIGKIKI